MLGPFHQELSKSFEVGTLNILGKKDCTSLTVVGITMEVDPHSAKQLHLHQASHTHGLLDSFADGVEGKKASTTPAVHESFGNGTPPAKTEISQ